MNISIYIHTGRKAGTGIHFTQNSSVEKPIGTNLLKYIFGMTIVVNFFPLK